MCVIFNMHAGVGTTDSALGDDGVLDIDTTISLETTWRATEDLVSMGLVRSIGNRLTPTHTSSVIRSSSFARSMGFVSQPILLLEGLAEKYTKTAAQIARRWGIQRNIVVIPKSLKLERLKENI
ncbi:hypothetical protein HN51_046863 [Arachis hypogaea]